MGMIARRVPKVRPMGAPPVARFFERRRGGPQNLGQMRQRNIAQGRVAVVTPTFVCHAVRAEVSLLQSVSQDPAGPCNLDSPRVFRPCVAIEDYVRDAVERKLIGEPVRVVALGAEITFEWACTRPFSLVTGIKGDTPHPCPGSGQTRGKAVKERPMWSLKKEESTPSRLVHHCFAPLTAALKYTCHRG